MTSTDKCISLWLPKVRVSPSIRLRLFCLPYAGGSAAIFQNWFGFFLETIDICPIQLPGRGMRMHESPIEELSSLVKAIVREISPYLEVPFAFFGHSLGGLIGFEVSHRLAKEHLPIPAHLFTSGCAAPSRQKCRRRLSSLPESALIEELRKLNGTPQAVLENNELMALVLPALRTDFSLFESYCYQQHPRLLGCPITVFGGSEDTEVDLGQLASWKDETHGRFTLHLLPGDHFFLHSAETELLTLMAQQIRSFTCKAA